MFILKKKLVLPAIEIHNEMNGREITLEESIIPKEKETLELSGIVCSMFSGNLKDANTRNL